MTKIKSFLFALSFMFAAVDAFADVTSQLSINGADSREVSITEPSEWRIKLRHGVTGELLTKFDRLHTRDMHMVIVKKDLSSFAHVHPVLIGKTGVFHTIINQAAFDPDNEQALRAIPSPGDYYVFTESSPKNHPELSYIELSRLAISAPGESKPEEFRLDPVDSDGEHRHHGSFSITKYFQVKGLPDPNKPWKKPKEYQVSPGKYGDYYRVRMHASLVAGCGGNMVQFHLDIDTWDNGEGVYKRVNALVPWLGMEAHAVLLQADPQVTADDIHFLHLHGMRHEEHNSLMFAHFDRGLMSGRNYRAWFQVRHHGHIATFPFSFHYMAPYKQGCD